MQGLLVQDGRNAQTRLLDQKLLQGVCQLRRLARVVLVARTGDLADPVRHDLACPRWRKEARLRVTDEGVVPVDRFELRHLLGRRHARQQVGHARLDRQLRIAVGRWGHGRLLRKHGAAEEGGDNKSGGYP